MLDHLPIFTGIFKVFLKVFKPLLKFILHWVYLPNNLHDFKLVFWPESIYEELVLLYPVFSLPNFLLLIDLDLHLRLSHLSLFRDENIYY